jgi:cytochrome c peroxidase
MAELPNGALLVAEDGTGQRDDSAGVSLVMPDGTAGRLISGFRSSRDSGDLAGSPLVGLSLTGDKIYVGNFAQGHLWTLPLSAEEQVHGLSLPTTPLTTAQLAPAMMPLNNVRVINPFDITFDPDGVPVVTDATGDGVAKENPDGTTRFIHRFASLPNPAREGDSISPVPTGITRIDDDAGGYEYFVTLTGGCPFPDGGGQLVAIDEQRHQRTVVGGLNMPIDVAQGPDGTIWVLEFARFTPDASCFSGAGYQQNTGRLSRLLPDGSLVTVIDHLNFPGAVLPARDGSLYISEVFPGRVLHVTFGEQAAGATGQEMAPPATPVPETGRSLTDVDAALREVILANELQPYPELSTADENPALVHLGQALFFDPILSGDENISCATCHHPSFAMADGRVLPIGTGGRGLGPERDFLDRVKLGPEADTLRRQAGETDPTTGETWVANPFAGQFVPRNSPTVLNSAFYPAQFWDGRVESSSPNASVRTLELAVNQMAITDPLAVQALFPISSLNEMAGATFGGLAPQAIRDKVLERLRAIPGYVQMFQDAFGEASPAVSITVPRLAEALAAFERTLIFTKSSWDDYVAGDEQALSPQEKRGALLFYGQSKPAVNCAQCHSGDLFTDFDYHNLLVPQLGPGKGHDYTRREDWGRGGVTFDLRDRYKFRTPSLRNVALTPPYFHDGAFATLEDAIRHHADIWNSAATYDPSANQIPAALYSSLRPFEPEKQWRTAAPALRNGLPLNDEDVADLAAFLRALTDPAAQDLDHLVPEQVPSGLPVDTLSDTRQTFH